MIVVVQIPGCARRKVGSDRRDILFVGEESEGDGVMYSLTDVVLAGGVVAVRARRSVNLFVDSYAAPDLRPWWSSGLYWCATASTDEVQMIFPEDSEGHARINGISQWTSM